ncbi:AAA family ATPase [Candidatus Bipolaricaulota bacterium]|nr:AAA family ATPase [Candidatus Bipolaricaulota bacterium]
MKSLIVASTREDAGKTSIIIALARILNMRFGYLKPLGDRFLYRKKRLWDYDASLLTQLFALGEEPETISIGFDHSKLRYMYDRKAIFQEYDRIVNQVGAGREAVFVECGKDLAYGASVYLDPLTISQETGAPVLIVASGGENEIADDLAFIHRFVGSDEANVAGVIINKVVQMEDFCQVHLPEIEKLGVNVLGVLPHQAEFETISLATVADKLFAKVLGGESGLTNRVRSVVVGAMSVNAALVDPHINDPGKLVITSGDRSDMILAMMETEGTAGIVLTNDIIPPANIVAKASMQNVPLLVVSGDTYSTALQIEKIRPLLRAEDTEQMAKMTALVSDHVDVGRLRELL